MIHMGMKAAISIAGNLHLPLNPSLISHMYYKYFFYQSVQYVEGRMFFLIHVYSKTRI